MAGENNGNGTKADIQWIKDALKEHGETLRRIDTRLDGGAEKCRARHEKLDARVAENKTTIAVTKKESGLLALLVSAFVSLVAVIVMWFRSN